MLEYIKENFGDRPSINESERMELEFLRSEVAKLKNEVGGGAMGKDDSTASDKKAGYDDSSSGSGSEGDDDFVDNLPVMVANKAGKPPPRKSVSAEAFGNFNKVAKYIPPVHKKSAQ